MKTRGTFRALAVLLVGVGMAWGQSKVRVVSVSAVSHGVQEKLPPPAGTTATVTAWTKVSRNAPVTEGEQIRSGSNAFVEIELECGSALRLAPQSGMAFPRLRLSRAGVPITTVAVQQGEAFFTLQTADSPKFQVLVPGGAITTPIGGATLRIDIPPNQPGSVEVLHGKVLAEAGGHSTEVKAKRRFTFLQGGGINQLAMLKPDAWQKWSQRRDEIFHRQMMLRPSMAPPMNLTPLIPQPGSEQPLTPEPTESLTPEQQLSPIVSELNREAQKHPTVNVPSCAHRKGE